MNIEEKTVITHEVHFTEEDYELIRSVMITVWESWSIRNVINSMNTGLGDYVAALRKVYDCAFYNRCMTDEDRKHFDMLNDMCCSFICRHENDERAPAVNEMWLKIIAIQKDLNRGDW